MSDNIPYTGDISVTSSGMPCMEWSVYLELSPNRSTINAQYADIHLFPEDNYRELGAKCR